MGNAGLILVGLVAGVVAGISPCILPVLPVILLTGAATGGRTGWRRRTRPVAIVAGLIVSFSFVVLAGSEVLSLLHLPQDFLRDAGIAVLAGLGVALLVPPVGRLMERPFARIGRPRPGRRQSGFVVGLALGAVFAPCAGPVLAAVTILGATRKVGLTAVVLTLAFAFGAAIPLLAVATAGQEVVVRVRAVQARAARLERVAGIVLIATAVLVGFNALDFLQRDVPGYTSALQTSVEGSSSVRNQLTRLTGGTTGATQGSLNDCDQMARHLVDCGPAPAFTGINAWLNTPAEAPLTLSALKGKVVLVDFWTYSCINCQRALPHVEAWYSRYQRAGLEVVGVHTPEFPFEHVVANVRGQLPVLGVRYPVAVDDEASTWNAFGNSYWPAEYLLDAGGHIRHESFGEGRYAETEGMIRQLLTAARPGISLPPPTSVPDATPNESTNLETYLGFEKVVYQSQQLVHDAATEYHKPGTIYPGQFAFDGNWAIHATEATAGPRASIVLPFMATDVYLVIGGSGQVQVDLDGKPYKSLSVSGPPTLYTLYHRDGDQSGTLAIHFSPGVEAYDFTFG